MIDCYQYSSHSVIDFDQDHTIQTEGLQIAEQDFCCTSYILLWITQGVS